MSKRQTRRKPSWVWWAVGAIILLSCISTVFGGGSNEPAAVVEVQAGHLRAEIGSIPKDATINVRKSDGTLDDRDGDLQTLVEEMNTWNDGFMRAMERGNTKKMLQYARRRKQTEEWLTEYNFDDMCTMYDAVQAGER